MRVLRFLSSGSTSLMEGAGEGKLLLEQADGKRIGARSEQVYSLQRRGLLRIKEGTVALTAEGSAAARRIANEADDGFQAQHREVEMRSGGSDGTMLRINLNESPLGQIAKRKDKQGRHFLSEVEVRAGERLRSDYTRGQIMPRLSANWEAGVSSGRGGGAGGMVELTEAALAARLRVEKAIAAVGPELSGVLLDVCCFLKGLEVVETERLWPARSAKIVLKAALGALSRHYEPPRTRPAAQIQHWGADGYRPSLAG